MATPSRAKERISFPFSVYTGFPADSAVTPGRGCGSLRSQQTLQRAAPGPAESAGRVSEGTDASRLIHPRGRQALRARGEGSPGARPLDHPRARRLRPLRCWQGRCGAKQIADGQGPAKPRPPEPARPAGSTSRAAEGAAGQTGAGAGAATSSRDPHAAPPRVVRGASQGHGAESNPGARPDPRPPPPSPSEVRRSPTCGLRAAQPGPGSNPWPRSRPAVGEGTDLRAEGRAAPALNLNLRSRHCFRRQPRLPPHARSRLRSLHDLDRDLDHDRGRASPTRPGKLTVLRAVPAGRSRFLGECAQSRLEMTDLLKGRRLQREPFPWARRLQGAPPRGTGAPAPGPVPPESAPRPAPQ